MKVDVRFIERNGLDISPERELLAGHSQQTLFWLLSLHQNVFSQ